MSDVMSHSHIVLDQDLARALQPVQAGQFGTAKMFELLIPSLYGYSDKKHQPLEKVDYYMLEETQELYSRLRRFCYHLKISTDTEFKVARRGDQLEVIGDVPHRTMLNQLVNDDLWFVDSFIWLQPNYSSLAHSFEMMEFAEFYQQSPVDAKQRYAHFDDKDKGMAFALKYTNGAVNAQVESPLNLYQV
jgi:hypothetical protein